MLDLLDALREVGAAAGWQCRRRIPVRAAGRGRRSWLDITRAREELGWVPEVSLRDGLERLLASL